MMWVLAPFYMKLDYWLQPAILIFVFIGLIRPALSVNLSVAGMRMLGPTLSSTLASVSPVFGVTLGVLWLGESLSWSSAFGTIGVVLAILLLAKKGKQVDRTWPLWAMLFPIGAALIRSAGHVFTKVGMESIPDPFFAALIGFSVSGLITIAAHMTRRTTAPIAWRSRGPLWFAAGGLVMGLAVLCLNTALLTGKVVEVLPVVAVSPVFTMLLTFYVFRREVLSARVVSAVFLVVPSVIFITLNR
jgi:drug/metabolite transporter (DMT)-like permease